MGKRAPLRVAAKAAGNAFIAYLRVSTDKQGASGLGLDAQHESIQRHLHSKGGRLLEEFVEIESGRKNDRPQLAKALIACRAKHATLIIAKLDRLSRNVHFISGLMESGVDFVAADMPTATRLTMHIYASVAEHEREMISERTKAALAAAKARGKVLGNPRLRAGDREMARRAANAKSGQAYARARDLMVYIEAARLAGCGTLQQIAEALMARGIRTPGGATNWSPTQVSRTMRRAAHGPPRPPR